ncbi:MAG: MBL fold metallo-hydrolase [Eubacteriaceae bacterium]|nr:MBL fold metallo-hydrolase [Eubacteriaceae bacterium]
MKITILVENTSKNKNLKPKHGLSIYVETDSHKLLFDIGPDSTIFDNAKKLGINISEVGTAIISHGHRDHGGALPEFLKANAHAKVYMRKNAFEPHYIKVVSAKVPIGINKLMAENERLVFTDGAMRLDDELFVFSDVQGSFDTAANRRLLKKSASGFEQDGFSHEQNLIISEKGKNVLFTGCSHKGIANILRSAKRHMPEITAVIGGFHLFNPATRFAEPQSVMQRLAAELSEHDAVFYTGHCTGMKAFRHMQAVMGDKLNSIATGSTIEI